MRKPGEFSAKKMLLVCLGNLVAAFVVLLRAMPGLAQGKTTGYILLVCSVLLLLFAIGSLIALLRRLDELEKSE